MAGRSNCDRAARLFPTVRRGRYRDRVHGSGHAVVASCTLEAVRPTLPAPRRLDRSNINLPHAHHRLERALCLVTPGGKRLGQHARRDLPRHAPLVFAPTARTLLAAIADDGVPVVVSLLLIVGGDLE